MTNDDWSPLICSILFFEQWICFSVKKLRWSGQVKISLMHITALPPILLLESQLLCLWNVLSFDRLMASSVWMLKNFLIAFALIVTTYISLVPLCRALARVMSTGEEQDAEAAAPMYVYESKVHCANVLLSLEEQRRQGILCDLTVLVEGREVRAHRAVLAASSRYFLQALLGHNGSPGEAEPIISLPDKVRASNTCGDVSLLEGNVTGNIKNACLIIKYWNKKLFKMPTSDTFHLALSTCLGLNLSWEHLGYISPSYFIFDLG